MVGRRQLLHEPNRALRQLPDRARVRQRRGHARHGDLRTDPEDLLLDRARRTGGRVRSFAVRQPERLPERFQSRGGFAVRRQWKCLPINDRPRNQSGLHAARLRRLQSWADLPADAVPCVLPALAQLGRHALRRSPRGQGHPQAFLEHVLGPVGDDRHGGPGDDPHREDDGLAVLQLRQRRLLQLRALWRRRDAGHDLALPGDVRGLVGEQPPLPGPAHHRHGSLVLRLGRHTLPLVDPRDLCRRL